MKFNSVFISFLLILLGIAVTYAQDPEGSANPIDSIPEKIQVLNFGTFHMGTTSDATETEFDEHDRKNQQRVHLIARLLAEFEPTVIVVELPPEYNRTLQADYRSYLRNPRRSFSHPTEIELLAYELGRLCGTKRIYGIDHKLEYNYSIGHEIKNTVDPGWYTRYYENPLRYHAVDNPRSDEKNLLEKLRITNQPAFLDFLKTVNADMLTHAGTDNGFEGADEAAKFYLRNLRMYTNLNRISLQPGDRVFILMGAAHTAFFRDFMRKSPKFEMVDTLQFLEPFD